MPSRNSGFDGPYLHQSLHGHVLRCTSCNRYEVVFRHVHVRLPPDHLGHLVRAVRSLPVEEWEAKGFGVIRLTPEDAPVEIHLKLFGNDVLELCELLDGAVAMAELEVMLENVLNAR